jgi:hypothetical protein
MNTHYQTKKIINIKKEKVFCLSITHERVRDRNFFSMDKFKITILLP